MLTRTYFQCLATDYLIKAQLCMCMLQKMCDRLMVTMRGCMATASMFITCFCALYCILYIDAHPAADMGHPCQQRAANLRAGPHNPHPCNDASDYRCGPFITRQAAQPSCKLHTQGSPTFFYFDLGQLHCAGSDPSAYQLHLSR